MAHCKGTINGDDNDGTDSDMFIILLFHLKLALKNLGEKSEAKFIFLNLSLDLGHMLLGIHTLIIFKRYSL